MGEQRDTVLEVKTLADAPESDTKAEHVEQTITQEGNLVYDGEEEPEIHMRTWIALAAMWLLNLVQVFALQGPPAVVCSINPKA